MRKNRTINAGFVWPDGDMLPAPTIKYGDNGYVYRPPELPHDKHSTFGRGAPGWDIARKEAADWVASACSKHGWAKPTRVTQIERFIEWKIQRPYYATKWHGLPSVSKGFEVASWDPVFGYVVARFLYWTDRNDRARSVLSIWGTPALKFFMDRSVEHVHVLDPDFICLQERSFENVDLKAEVNQWMEDPFRYVIQRSLARIVGQEDKFGARFFELVDSSTLDRVAHLPVAEKPIEIIGDDGNLDGFMYAMDRSYRYDTRHVESVLLDGTTLDDITLAFATYGVTVSWDYIRESWAQQRVTGFSLSVDANGEPGREFDHNFRFSLSGVTVVCGYLQDEKRRLEHEHRKAAQILNQLKDEYEETTYEIGAT